MSVFGAHLKLLRKSRKITQKELAQSIGASERGIQQIELEESKPSFDTLIALADYFDVSLDGRSDDPERHSGTPSTQLSARINNLPQREQKIVSALVDALEEYEKV